MIQSNIEGQAYQVQQILANKLDKYKRQENQYIDDNIQEIQELYKDIEQKKKSNGGRIVSRIKEVDLIFFYFLFSFYSLFRCILLYSIFRTRVRVK